jgi:4'-phosphopantetheinyl transferase EntD
VFRELLPPTAVVEVVEGDDPDAFLFPEELAAVDRAIDRRKREHAIGRSCARRALTRLGLPPLPILSGPKREPLWPDGVVGSITHCEGYSAAAVAKSSQLLAIGIDAEEHAPLPAGVLERIALPEERERLGAASADTHWDRLLFSAKEATYKAYYPLAKAWLGFEQAAITFDADTGTFQVRLLVEPIRAGSRTLRGFEGRFAIQRNWVLTAIAVAAE